MVKKNVVETPIEDLEEVEEIVEKVVKPKRVMNEKQLEALKKGRELGILKKKQMGELTNEKKKVENVVKAVKQEAKVASIDDLRKVADTYELRKKIDTIDEKLSSYLDEKKERRKMKESTSIDRSVKAQLPRAVNEAMMIKKLQGEYNPFIGLV